MPFDTRQQYSYVDTYVGNSIMYSLKQCFPVWKVNGLFIGSSAMKMWSLPWLTCSK